MIECEDFLKIFVPKMQKNQNYSCQKRNVDDGEKAGYDKGERAGCELTKKIYKAYIKGESIEVIAKECNIPVSQVEKILQ